MKPHIRWDSHLKKWQCLSVRRLPGEDRNYRGCGGTIHEAYSEWLKLVLLTIPKFSKQTYGTDDPPHRGISPRKAT